MRIVHVSPTDIEGGASKGAYRLHVGLQAAGVESLMLVQRKYSDDPSVMARGKAGAVLYQGLRDRLDRLPLRLYDWRKQNWWTVGWLPFDISGMIDWLKPDIVQLHWAGRGAAPIKLLRRLRHYPLVWTLRDMWPLTGGCHYSAGCEKYLTGCGTCPQLGSNSNYDISRWQWHRKYRAWKGVDITYVALSNWMAECAHRSPLTFGNKIAVIPNGVDTERFAPVNKTMARTLWHLPTDKRIIMFGAINSTTDPRKGFSYLCKALQTLASQGWADRCIAVVFGARTGDPQLGIEARYVGHLRDDVSLALLYACADVMVVPSVEENFAKTPIEAMACGVPVTAFANTGQFDIVDHRVNGYLAENLSAADLAQGIAWCLEEGERDRGLARRARAKAVERFDIRDIVTRHVALYERLLQQRRQVEGSTLSEDEDFVGISSAVEAIPRAFEEVAVKSQPERAP